MAEHEVKRLSMMMMLGRQAVQADFQRREIRKPLQKGREKPRWAEDMCPGGRPLSKTSASVVDTNKRDTYKRKRDRERERERERERGREERRTKKVGAFFYPADRVVNTYVIKLW